MTAISLPSIRMRLNWSTWIENSSEYGMFVRFEVPHEEGCFDPQNKLWWDRDLDRPISTHTPGADPYLPG